MQAVGGKGGEEHMDLRNLTIGYGITGSFCTHAKTRKVVEELVEAGAKVVPIFSYETQSAKTRFGSGSEFVKGICELTNSEGIRTIVEAEPIGPKGLLDVMVIAPCTGNSMAKLEAGITDTPVLMAAKAHLRNNRPLVISISTNDALGMNFKNIGKLMYMKNIYFVPFGQDDYAKKPSSMVARTKWLPETIEEALRGRQIQPVLR